MSFLSREWRRLVNRCVWSWAGLVAVWRGEPSFRFWSVVNACSVALALTLPLSAEGRALILALGVLVLAAEALNTGIEAAVDHTSSDRSDLARYAKDAASAGVALTAVAAGIAWVFLIMGVVSAPPA